MTVRAHLHAPRRPRIVDDANRVHGKRAKIGYVPAHPASQRLIEDYLLVAGHGADKGGPLFRPARNNRSPEGLDPASIYRNTVRKCGLATGINAEVNSLRVHSLRATAATNALDHDSDIAKVQE